MNGIVARTLNRLGQWIARHPRRVLIAGALVAIPACLAAFSLRPQGNLAAMLSLDQPSAQSLARITERFRGTDELIVLASAPDSLDRGAAADRLYSFAERLQTSIDANPELRSLVRGVHFQPSDEMRRYVQEVIAPNIAYYVPPESWPGFLQRFTSDGIRQRLARLDALLSAPAAGGGAVAKAAMKDPLGIHEFVLELMPSVSQSGAGAFLSPDGRHLMIRIQGRDPVANLDFAAKLTELVSLAAAEANADGLQLRFTGPYAIAATSQSSIRRDMIFTITGSMIALQLLFWIIYRELWTFPLVIAPVALGIILAFAVAKLAGIPLTPMTAVIGGILAGLGIDYCIHPLSRYRYEAALTSDRSLAIGKALADVVPPNAAALITTASGFLALSATSVQMVRSFGLIGSLGLAGCFVVCLFLFPAMLAALPGRSRSFTGRRATAARLIEFIVAHRMIAIGFCVALACFALGVIVLKPAAGIEGDLSTLHPTPNPALTAQKELVEIFGAANEPWLVHLQAADGDSLAQVAHEVKRRLTSAAEKQGTVSGTLGLASLLPDSAMVESRRRDLSAISVEDAVAAFRSEVRQSALNPDPLAGYEEFIRKVLTASKPPDIDTLARYGEIAGLLLASQGQGQGLQKEAVTAVFLSNVMDTRAGRDQAIAELRTALAGLPGATLTGLSVVGHDFEEQIKEDLARSMWIADVLVLGSLLLYFRSVRLMLLAAIPPAFAALLLYAGMQLLDIRLNLVNLVGLPLLVGIGVDNGVFLTSLTMHGDKALPSARDGETPQPPQESGHAHGHETLIERMGAAAHAITMTTLTTVLTFGSLLLTNTPAIRSLGLLMVVGVASALVAALGLLCPLLVGRKTAA